MTEFMVTKSATRPAGRDDQCFYCHQPIGAPHKEDCVLVAKKVKIRLIAEYDVEVPASWDSQMVEFHRNESSWCVNNCLDELRRLAPDDRCLCEAPIKFEFVEETSAPFLSE